MTKRVCSTLLIWGLIAAVLFFFRSAGAVVLIAVVSALTLRELYGLLATAGAAPFAGLGTFFGVLITVAPCLDRFGMPSHALLPLAVVLFGVRILGEREPEKRVPALTSTIFGLAYVALLLQYLVRIIVSPRSGPPLSSDGHLLLCLWVVAVAKFCDTGALLSGLAFGRRALAPQISPKKTWEGAIGGVLSSMLVGAVFAWFARGSFGAVLPPFRAALVAAPLAVVAILADLVESILKRHAALKDSGRAIPGIGGILDMSDSLLLAAPVAYVLLGFR